MKLHLDFHGVTWSCRRTLTNRSDVINFLRYQFLLQEDPRVRLHPNPLTPQPLPYPRKYPQKLTDILGHEFRQCWRNWGYPELGQNRRAPAQNQLDRKGSRARRLGLVPQRKSAEWLPRGLQRLRANQDDYGRNEVRIGWTIRYLYMK